MGFKQHWLCTNPERNQAISFIGVLCPCTGGLCTYRFWCHTIFQDQARITPGLLNQLTCVGFWGKGLWKLIAEWKPYFVRCVTWPNTYVWLPPTHHIMVGCSGTQNPIENWQHLGKGILYERHIMRTWFVMIQEISVTQSEYITDICMAVQGLRWSTREHCC
jgi:hypothetical protein